VSSLSKGCIQVPHSEAKNENELHSPRKMYDNQRDYAQSHFEGLPDPSNARRQVGALNDQSSSRDILNLSWR
jgi:hypothetical protein